MGLPSCHHDVDERLHLSSRIGLAIRYIRSRLQIDSTALLGAAFLLTPEIAYGECLPGGGTCHPNPPSCSASNSCASDGDCAVGSLCIPYVDGGTISCLPSACECYQDNWVCTDDCASQCVAGLPDDIDRDGIPDSSDNCVIRSNPQQSDPDLDGYGTRCDGDFDQDGDTDQDDVDFFSANCTSDPIPAICDFNDNGIYDIDDAATLISLVGSPPGPSGLACAGTVPCAASTAVPTLGRVAMTGLLAILGTSAVVWHRRRMIA